MTEAEAVLAVEERNMNMVPKGGTVIGEEEEEESFEEIDPIEEVCTFFMDHGFNGGDNLFGFNEDVLATFLMVSGYHRFSKDLPKSKLALRSIAAQ